MKKILLVFTLLLATAACIGKRTWSQSDRDKLISTCAETASKNYSLDKVKMTNYCTCYQQNLEKSHPNVTDLVKMSTDEMTQAAKECLSLILK